MRLLDITATAASAGNQIDLSWAFPGDPPYPQVLVVRREGSHPADPTDGHVVPHPGLATTAQDTGLLGERAYYYTLFPFTGGPPVFDPDPHNRTSALALSPYGFGERLHQLLPAIYRRFDTVVDAAGDGQLRRFLALPGGELDRLYSLTRAALGLTDVDQVEGVLLPLLAQWIGWRTNFGLPVGAQRTEIQYAPRLYQTIGGVPTLDATVARVGGFANQTKEFVHNVARSNQPERLNLWSSLRGAAGPFGLPALASLNFAYDGRPAAVTEADGSVRFFYHTLRRHGWDIWTKRYTTADGWLPSAPVVDRPGIDKHPAAARQGGTLWLFWQSYGESGWRIDFSRRIADTWSEPSTLGDPSLQRRSPAAVADGTGGLWLFWLEQAGAGWQLRYNRHDGTDWLPAAVTFPLDGGRQPRVEEDLFAMFHPGRPAQPLWLFWARREPGGPAGQARWNVVYRIKQSVNPSTVDWSPIAALPRTDTGYHDRQPAALPAGADLELFWTSTRHGGWSVLRDTLAVAANTWGTAERVSTDPYSNRGPLAVPVGSATLLAYRSTQSITYPSATFGASQTLDTRYSGTSTVDSGAAEMLKRRGAVDDFGTYTYDTGPAGVPADTDRIARDTVGLYLSRRTGGPPVTAEAVSHLASVLADFVPVTTRTVIITP